MPRAIEFVVMSEHEMLHVVEGVPAAVDSVNAGIKKIISAVEGVTHAGCEGRLGVINPRRGIVARLKTCLDKPMVVEFYRGQNSCLSKWVSGEEQRVGICVIAGRE